MSNEFTLISYECEKKKKKLKYTLKNSKNFF